MLRAGQSDPAIKIEASVKVDGGCPARTGTRQQGAFGTEPSPWAMPATSLTSVRGKQVLAVGHVTARIGGGRTFWKWTELMVVHSECA